jgi:hypothetical protein
MTSFGKLGVGPMSSEVIEAVFRYSEQRGKPLMLIASQNQIDWDKGYVNNWNTKQYAEFVTQMREKYPKARVMLCRDHCGPGFKSDDLSDTYKTIDSDLENGFEFIHIDFCHYPGSHEEQIKAAKEAILYVKNKAPEAYIEVGTDENLGDFLEDISRIEREMEFFTQDTKIDFFVCQTGSLTKEINQRGSFNKSFIEQIRPVADRYGILLKEHNGDYLGAAEIHERQGLIDAMNVAPQFGVIQTQLTLSCAAEHGIDTTAYLKRAYESRKWEKWLDKHTSGDRELCAVIAGHYNFATEEYATLMMKLEKVMDFREKVIEELMNVYDLYVANL